MASADTKYFETFFIDEKMLKLYSTLPNNISVNKVLPFINLAQPYYIEPILGQALSEQLKEEISKATLTDEDKALLIKIGPAEAMWTTYLAARSLLYQIEDKGITSSSSENSEPISDRALGHLIEDYKKQAEMATELLIRYLCQCADLYPNWVPDEECNCNKYEKHPDGIAKQNRKFTIYFPNKGNGCGCECNDNNFITK